MDCSWWVGERWDYYQSETVTHSVSRLSSMDVCSTFMEKIIRLDAGNHNALSPLPHTRSHKHHKILFYCFEYESEPSQCSGKLIKHYQSPIQNKMYNLLLPDKSFISDIILIFFIKTKSQNSTLTFNSDK